MDPFEKKSEILRRRGFREEDSGLKRPAQFVVFILGRFIVFLWRTGVAVAHILLGRR